MDIKAFATASNFTTSRAASKQAQQFTHSIRHCKMANGKQTLLLLLLLLAVLYSVESLSSIQVCGSQLSETIYAVCKGKFMPIHQYKRGALDLFDYVESQKEHNVDDADFDSLGEVAPRGRHSTLLATRRLSRGVVNECCLKPCTTKVMEKYCAY
ncbi:probable insulin-like peptide 5 [Drosophila navojoa]|uniref:probable insulin-like peptide 5 n=1 Tax=Drosophila navojoa TaxID=7232 RepID=UPI0008462B8B|nr:probable insulin-like peptide 5 [Drosophila navojoa]